MSSVVVYVGPQSRALDFLDSLPAETRTALSVLTAERLDTATLTDSRLSWVVVDPASDSDETLLAETDAAVLTTTDSDVPATAVDERVPVSGDPPAALARRLSELVGDTETVHEKLAALQETTRKLIVATSHQSVAEITVSAAESVLDMPGTSLWTYDETDHRLHPTAMTDDVRAAYDGEPPAIGPEDERLWTPFENGQFRVFEDITYRIEATDTVVRSGVAAPLGEQGLLITGATTTGVADTDVELFQLLASAAGAALERADRERELERQNERLDQFTSVVSHDLQSPIQLAVTQLELYRATGEERHLDKLETAHERMTTLVDDLLTLARQGETIDTLEDVSLSTITDDAWHEIDPDGARLCLVEDLRIEADPARLTQLLSNLFRNAVEHSSTSPRLQAHEDTAGASSSEPSVGEPPEDAVEHSSTSPDSQARQDAVEYSSTSPDSAVTVTVGRLDGENGFYVADDGPGIPVSKRDRVFERGYTTSGDGTGFGLAIVESIVDAHGWAIDVTDSETGGARFEISGCRTS